MDVYPSSMLAVPPIRQEEADDHSGYLVTGQLDSFKAANTSDYLKPSLVARADYLSRSRPTVVWQPVSHDFVPDRPTRLPDLSDPNSEWFEDSLQELEECPDCAHDEDMAEPSVLAMTKARQLLKDISVHVKDRPDVYPMDESGIAIDFRNSDGQSGVLFLIENDGSGALFYRTTDSRGRLRVDDARALLREGGIRALERAGIR